MPLTDSPTVIQLQCASKDIKLFRMMNRLDNYDMRRLMDAGWVIIAGWIDNPIRIPIQIGTVCVNGICFRIARGIERMIVEANIYVDVPSTVIENIDADEPGSVNKMLPSTANESWLMRLSSMAGFGPGSGGGAGVVAAINPPKFSIVGLDIEVSTFARNGKMPLPHDDMISIVISNGGWHDDDIEDVCYCIYTFGYHRDIELDNGRKPIFIKAKSSTHSVEIAYEILNSLSPDFVNVHNGFGFDLNRLATHSALSSKIAYTFEDRRLGNTGEATYWRLPNGVMFVDSMYDVDKYQRGDWPSISLASLATILELPPKLDVDDMMIEASENYDVTQMLVYNARDSDLHAWVCRSLKMCDRYFILAGTSRSPIWDACAGNTGYMMFCLQASVALSRNLYIDLSRSAGSDERDFEGGFVLEPKPGCYKGVVVIDGNSLYGSIMSQLGIFIDRCVSSPTPRGLAEKLDRDVEEVVARVELDDVVEFEDLILMRSKDAYMCVKKGPHTILNVIIDELIRKRKEAKASGDTARAWSNKMLVVSCYGAMGSRHGAISSKTCAEIVTYTARYYLRMMIRAAESCGFEVIYGDTDSIFVWTKGTTEMACSTAGIKVKKAITELTKGTAFANVGADVKGNYESIVISAKKKYEAVNWDGSLDTKGLAIVKKDTLPIVRYALSLVLKVLNSSFSEQQKIDKLVKIVSGIMKTLQQGKLPVKSQVTEVKINGQPHIVYVDKNMQKRRILIGIGVKVSEVNKKWVAKRIASAIDSVIVPIGMGNVSQLLFIYESRRRMGVMK